MRLSYRLAPALILAALLPSSSFAQVTNLTPIVATFTVPVTVTNMDDEAMHKVIGDIHVRCQVFSAADPKKASATGSTKVELVITDATTSTRAMANFKGNVVVDTRVPIVGATTGLGGQATQGEAADQAKAQKAIDSAKTYRCDLMSKTAVVKGLTEGDLTVESLTSKIKGEPSKPTIPITVTVNGSVK
jgi:hypothetical protein